MKNLIIGALLTTAFLSLSARAEPNVQNDTWLFWCRIAETGQKIQLTIPVSEEKRNEALFTIGQEVGDTVKTTYRVHPHAIAFSLSGSTLRDQWISQVQVDLGRSGTVRINIPEAEGASEIVSTMMEFFHPKGVQAEYCSTFYSTGPKPISSGGN